MVRRRACRRDASVAGCASRSRLLALQASSSSSSFLHRLLLKVCHRDDDPGQTRLCAAARSDALGGWQRETQLEERQLGRAPSARTGDSSSQACFLRVVVDGGWHRAAAQAGETCAARGLTGVISFAQWQSGTLLLTRLYYLLFSSSCVSLASSPHGDEPTLGQCRCTARVAGRQARPGANARTLLTTTCSAAPAR